MPIVKFPYGLGHLSLSIPDKRLVGILLSRAHDYRPPLGEAETVRQALANPIGTPKLSELAAGRKNVVYLASDHTRPVPTKAIFPEMVREIRSVNPTCPITILVGTGSHRVTTKEELDNKFGPGVLDGFRLEVHDCDRSDMVWVGKLPSGGDFKINRTAVEADLLLAEGFIEPHFFAGFSGGRKSVLPGITDRAGVMYNHCSAFIDHPRSRTGLLEGNLIHKDMVYAAQAVNLAFIVNAVLDSEKKAIAAFAGHFDLAHLEGVAFLDKLAGVKAAPADIVITTNGGYPLDQNIYQSVKGMTAAEASIKPGGVIIIAAKCNDGHGAEGFIKTFREEKDLKAMTETFMARDKQQTVPDQWQSQILARILLKHKVIMVTEPENKDLLAEFQIDFALSLEDALQIAESHLGQKEATITAIPDGVGVIVT
jgi:nickel-dependent lactate racemase